MERTPPGPNEARWAPVHSGNRAAECAENGLREAKEGRWLDACGQWIDSSLWWMRAAVAWSRWAKLLLMLGYGLGFIAGCLVMHGWMVAR